ncbi:hypothetical protein Q4494_06780 [Celeribacter halophilus]|uniref:Uncharacterized protein n=1 Tax=Celeribacter halophilus TaxID=576117 RepID=A0AAW7XS82_9RHOB|nr:hypothetical protein [Celeribacter halophilus]MDO6456777.1 hypothetical protein [Celeribacter halophilus]
MRTKTDLIWQRIELLEKALAEYIEKYGLTDRARAAMSTKVDFEKVKKNTLCANDASDQIKETRRGRE